MAAKPSPFTQYPLHWISKASFKASFHPLSLLLPSRSFLPFTSSFLTTCSSYTQNKP